MRGDAEPDAGGDGDGVVPGAAGAGVRAVPAGGVQDGGAGRTRSVHAAGTGGGVGWTARGSTDGRAQGGRGGDVCDGCGGIGVIFFCHIKFLGCYIFFILMVGRNAVSERGQRPPATVSLSSTTTTTVKRTNERTSAEPFCCEN